MGTRLREPDRRWPSASDEPVTSPFYQKRRLFLLVSVVLGLAVSFLLAEILLRLSGFSPWHYVARTGSPSIQEPDEILGWRNKAGHFRIPPHSVDGVETEVTNWSDGRRATAPEEHSRPDAVAVLGCSFTQGWAISDSETYAWKLQQRYPFLEVRNYGTAGYGTYQCLLVLERILARPNPPRLVIYGFIDHHEARNVAESSWMRVVEQMSTLGEAGLPYCTLGQNGELIRHAVERYPALPLHQYLATAVLAERVFLKWKSHRRPAQAREVTTKLLLEMQRLCRLHKATFVMAFLKSRDDLDGGTYITDYRRFCEMHRIKFIDCLHPFKQQMRVPGDGHPNGMMNDLWVEDIDRALHDPLLAWGRR